MKKIISILLVFMLAFSCMACAKTTEPKQEIVPQASQMKAICELATMKCYYHNVAKYTKEDAAGILWWKKDRRFWIEYDGIVTMGIDASLVDIEVDNDTVTITIPPAKVLGFEVDETTLNEDSYIVDTKSAKVKAEHQTEAFKQAQDHMKEEAEKDTLLLANAQQRAQKLLEDYVNNIGNCVEKTYNIKWIYLDGAKELNEVDLENTSDSEASSIK